LNAPQEAGHGANGRHGAGEDLAGDAARSAGPLPPRTIPLAQPWIGARERELLEMVLSSGVLGLGRMADAFEAQVATVAGRRHGMACSSGTAGLHMAVRALGIADGDEVVTTAFSFIASANCILYERAIPRFVDIDEDTLGLDPELAFDVRGDRIKAILPVHVFGRPCRIHELEALAGVRGWSLIEDACEALGSTRQGRPMGSFGSVSVFAFYPNKQITTGEGGVVVTDDDDIATAIRSMRNQGRDDDGTWLRHVRLGFNYRLDELSAAVGVAQLERLPDLRTNRRRVAAAYAAHLGSEQWVRLPRPAPDEDVDWFVYVVRLDPAIDRSRVIDDLAGAGVQTRPYFSPLHLQPALAELGYRAGDLPVTERVAATTLALPFSALRTDDDVQYVADALKRAVRGAGRSSGTRPVSTGVETATR
jgi:perosamine synthetase